MNELLVLSVSGFMVFWMAWGAKSVLSNATFPWVSSEVMEECSSFFFRNKVIFVIENIFFWATCWVWRCLLMDQVLWQCLRWALWKDERNGQWNRCYWHCHFVHWSSPCCDQGWLWSVLICCCSAPLSSLWTGCVVRACWWCKKVCFVYICHGCTGLYGKGEGFILCSSSEGF